MEQGRLLLALFCHILYNYIRFAFGLLAILPIILLGGCAETVLIAHSAKKIREFNSSTDRKGYYKVGTPYKIKNVWYYPKVDYSYDETGIGSWYGPNFHQKLTANGEIFDQNALSAAHRTLPMPSVVRVTNLENGRALVVRINDRGPFAHGRIIDLSRRSAQLLGFKRQGTAKMRVEILPEETRQEIVKIKGEYVQKDKMMASNAPVPDAVPVTTVSVKSLAQVPGTSIQKIKQPLNSNKPQNRRLSGVQLTKASRASKVQYYKVKESHIFVQAAAFSTKDSANRLKNKLSNVGKTGVYQTVINGKVFYRVRIGPFSNNAPADEALSNLIENGFPGARIIISNKK